METIFDAKELRRSGYYIWYAPKKMYLELLEKLNINFKEISDNVERLENDEKYFAIYVGIAENQPVIRRIGHHLYNSFDSSTLRKSVAAVYETKNHDEINKFMDKLKVKIFEYSGNLHEKEKDLLQKYFFVLNIQGNRIWANIISLLIDRRRNMFR